MSLEVLSGSIFVRGDAGGDEEYQHYSNSNVLAKTANQIPQSTFREISSQHLSASPIFHIPTTIPSATEHGIFRSMICP